MSCALTTWFLLFKMASTKDSITKERARYIVLEGLEGVGKTTQCKMLVECLREMGFSVLETKEPGTSHLPITMTLRSLMLDFQYDSQLTPEAREYISQAIRSIHLQKLIKPARDKYDFIIQDRGLLSGIAYGNSCGISFSNLQNLTNMTVRGHEKLYDTVIFLKGDIETGLSRARSSKKEFENGDAMENRGLEFLQKMEEAMEDNLNVFGDSVVIQVDHLTKEEVLNRILKSLQLDSLIH